jgi:hypothetical protein
MRMGAVAASLFQKAITVATWKTTAAASGTGPPRKRFRFFSLFVFFFFCKKSKEQQKLTNAEKRGIERKARRERGMAETKNELGKSKFRSYLREAKRDDRHRILDNLPCLFFLGA